MNIPEIYNYSSNHYALAFLVLLCFNDASIPKDNNNNIMFSIFSLELNQTQITLFEQYENQTKTEQINFKLLKTRQK